MIKTINLSLPEELLAAVDDAASIFYATRSEYIRHALIEQMRVDGGTHHERRKTHKRLPSRFLKPSLTEEFEIDDSYEL